MLDIMPRVRVNSDLCFLLISVFFNTYELTKHETMLQHREIRPLYSLSMVDIIVCTLLKILLLKYITLKHIN